MTELTAEQWQAVAEGQKKANWFHHKLLREIQDDILLAIQSNYDRDQLQLVLTQIQVKLMDNGIHPQK